MRKRASQQVSRSNAASDPEQSASKKDTAIWVAVIGGLFTLAGIALTAYLNVDTRTPVPTPTAVVPTTQSITPVSGTCPDDMILVQQGQFWMGAVPGDADAQKDEKPGKRIDLDSFCIDRLEVSNGQYAQFVSAAKHGSPPPANPMEPDSWIGTTPPSGYIQYPVVRVSWFDAKDYCEWKERKLPTEAQWEKAARGTTQWIYPWGNRWDATRANAGTPAGSSLQPVSSSPGGDSQYGVRNMAGNAAEWVADQYQEDWYSKMSDANPVGPINMPTQVVRGGSFVDAPKLLRISARLGMLPNFPNLAALKNIGFRCAQHPFG